MMVEQWWEGSVHKDKRAAGPLLKCLILVQLICFNLTSTFNLRFGTRRALAAAGRSNSKRSQVLSIRPPHQHNNKS
jgi:hypothetical protein